MSAFSGENRVDVPDAQVCPECGRAFENVTVETHLRQAHHIHQFRGKRYAEHELIPVLLAFALSPNPAVDAWEQLVATASEWLGWEAPKFLVQRLTGVLRSADFSKLERIIQACAQAAAGTALAPRLIAGLAAGDEVISRRLALALVARLPGPVEEPVLEAIAPLLAARDLPTEEQTSAVRALLRGGMAGAAAQQIVESFVADMSKPRALARLELLERSAGPIPVVAGLRARIENQVRMRCPRCPAELRRKDMIGHLWSEHGLVLDGKHAREPWRIIEDWVDEYRQIGDADLLKRCHELAQRIDPSNGLRGLRRLLLAREVDDAQARNALLAEAQQKEVSLCPQCFEFIPLGSELKVPVVNQWRGRLSALGYKVEVDDSGLFSHLVIATPDRTVARGAEPGRVLTVRAWLLLFGSLPVGVAILLAAFLPVNGPIPVVPVALLLMVSFALYVISGHRKRATPAERSLRRAWSDLAPSLLEGQEGTEGHRFVAGLATLCEKRAWYKVARDTSRLGQEKAQQMLDAGVPAAALLAAWHRLSLASIAASRKDPLPMLVEQIARCFRGDLPLSYAQHLLSGCEWLETRRADPARLRVLLCAAAFEAGFEVRNILEICQAAPALDRAFQGSNLRSLALLRLLWSMRATQPWERCGPARTAFGIAADPRSAALLADLPEPLLVDEDPTIELFETKSGKARPARIAVCSGGVMVGDVLLASAPDTVSARKSREPGCNDLVLGDQVLRFGAGKADLAARVGAWVQFYFEEMRPQCAEVLRWHSGTIAQKLRPQQLVQCPGCRRKVFPRAGEVAESLEMGRLL
jgi:hypothetical protein